ncbi:MAG: rhomboid family intramembrane serine protease, partial [Bdellovibrionales bacterium]|nr:rhomboid family intramembrane serine protease [Bdellovibrionales bacterium]
WWFGADLERVWGSKKFLRYYLFTGIGSGIISLFMKMPTIGASGSIYGLLFAFGMLYPNRTIYLYFILPIRAKYFVLLFGLIELAALMSSKATGINHWAHLGGLFFGFLWFFIEKNRISPRTLIRRYRYYRYRKRFTLIVNQEEQSSEQGPYSSDKNPTIH